MGIFHDNVTVINLAPIALNVTFDGQTLRIPPGESVLPKVTVAYAKNQNPVPGSADMDNPTISGARYLISIKGHPKERQEPFTQAEWGEMQGKASRFDTDAFFEDRLGPKEHAIVRGKGRKVQAKSSFDAGVRVSSPETFAESQ
jgi:hypothetical protein